MKKDNLARKSIFRSRAVSLVMACAMVLGSLWIGPGRTAEAATSDEGVGVLTIEGEDVTLDGSDVIDDSGQSCKATDLKKIRLQRETVYIGSEVNITGTVGNSSTIVEITGYGCYINVESGGVLNASSITGHVSTNNGTINAETMSVSSSGSARTFTNAGTINLTGTYTIENAGGTFNNSGVLKADVFVLDSTITCNNTGEIQANTLSMYTDGSYRAKLYNENLLKLKQFNSKDFASDSFYNRGALKVDDAVLTPKVMTGSDAFIEVRNYINIYGFSDPRIGIRIGKVKADPDAMIMTDGGEFTLEVNGKTKTVTEYTSESVRAGWLVKEAPEMDVDMPSSVYYGTEYDVLSHVTMTAGDGALSVSYAESRMGDDFTDPTTTKPTKPGVYRAYIKSAETEDYRPGSAEADFEIVYLDETTARCTVSGTLSEATYGGAAVYTSPVTVTAPAGYKIRWSEQEGEVSPEDFKASLKLDEERYYDGVIVYYRRNSDGAITESRYGYSTSFYVDTTGPAIVASKADSKEMDTPAASGKTYTARDLELDLTDEMGIQSVTVNGEDKTGTAGAGSMKVTLSAKKPGKTTFKVVASDVAGNKSNWTITLDYALVDPPKTAYTISGTKGKKGWYTSKVSLIPAEGYRISDTLGGTYLDELPYDPEITEVWLQNAKSGIYTSSSEVEEIRIDDLYPVLYRQVKGAHKLISDGDILYGREIRLGATDANPVKLISVTVDGQELSVDSGEDFPVLEAKKTVSKATVVIEDEAGNETEVTFSYQDDALVPTCSATVEDIHLGEEPDPVFETDSDAKADAVFEYKAVDAEDTEYTETKPTELGEYMIRVTTPMTEASDEGVCTATFRILKKEASASVSLQNPLAGTEYYPTVTTDSDGSENVFFEYRVNVEGSLFSTTKPKTAGNYVVRATVPETDMYQSVSCMAEYTILYLETPEKPYVITNEVGKNGYYREDVILEAPEGYTISASPDSGFAKSILYVVGMTKIYLKRDGDDALTGEIALGEILIDKEAPTLTGITGDDDLPLFVTTGAMVYSDSLHILLEDDHLVSVTIGSEVIMAEEGKADILLTADGEIKPITLIAEDIAGNTYELTFTLLAAWRQNDQVPSGVSVTLEKGHEYQLGEGNWTVDGDTTVYGGGRPFYVSESRKYKITQS